MWGRLRANACHWTSGFGLRTSARNPDVSETETCPTLAEARSPQPAAQVRRDLALDLTLLRQVSVERDRAARGGSRRTPEAQRRRVVIPRAERASEVRREAPAMRRSQPAM